MHRRGKLEHFDRFRPQSVQPAQQAAVFGNAAHVVARIFRAQLPDVGKRENNIFLRLFDLFVAVVFQLQVRLYPGFEFACIERFDDIVDTADLETAADFFDIRKRRQENDGNVFRFFRRFELFAGSETVHHGHHDIEQNQIELALQRFADRFFTVFGDHDVVAFAFEQFSDQYDVRRRIVDDKNICGT